MICVSTGSKYRQDMQAHSAVAVQWHLAAIGCRHAASADGCSQSLKKPARLRVFATTLLVSRDISKMVPTHCIFNTVTGYHHLFLATWSPENPDRRQGGGAVKKFTDGMSRSSKRGSRGTTPPPYPPKTCLGGPICPSKLVITCCM